MTVPRRRLVRIASDICDQLRILKQGKQRQVQGKLANVIEQMQRLQAIRRKLNLCESRGWNAASEKVMRQIEPGLREVPYHIQQVEQAV